MLGQIFIVTIYGVLFLLIFTTIYKDWKNERKRNKKKN